MQKDKQSLLWIAAFRINWLVERICALLVGIMVMVIWFGVVERYFLHLGFTWTEELSRYVMIWAALLAVSCGAFYREHIGLDIVKRFLPSRGARILAISLDLVSLSFFLFLAWYGMGMARAGLGQYATIFGMTMVVPFAAVPVSSVLTAFQIFAAMFRSSEPAGFATSQTQ
ncbi:TRAP transporter small permease [Desulfopila sp. IMCC35006]|uniref:TRAP transporter small permease n=1 Tax=Desulfopila sp. IMCC35006 TaxID=2569542 RepID=UPI0010AD492F|nr:TRAP transporter small permease [Desulfopila sp. IMCC35006]TKB25647.1 TRAP transporter small permease [Desulfopila sp. IMCC35006]